MIRLPVMVRWALEKLRYHLGAWELHESLNMLRELERTVRREWTWRTRGKGGKG